MPERTYLQRKLAALSKASNTAGIQHMIVPGYSGTFPVGPNTRAINGVPRSKFTLPTAPPTAKPPVTPRALPTSLSNLPRTPVNTSFRPVASTSSIQRAQPSSTSIPTISSVASTRPRQSLPAMSPISAVPAKPTSSFGGVTPPVQPAAPSVPRQPAMGQGVGRVLSPPSPPTQPMGVTPSAVQRAPMITSPATTVGQDARPRVRPVPQVMQPAGSSPTAPAYMSSATQRSDVSPRTVSPLSRMTPSTFNSSPQLSMPRAPRPTLSPSMPSRSRLTSLPADSNASIASTRPKLNPTPYGMPTTVTPASEIQPVATPPVLSGTPGFAPEMTSKVREYTNKWYNPVLTSNRQPLPVSTSHSYQSLGDHVGRHYANVPGGFNAAIAASQRAQRLHDQGANGVAPLNRSTWPSFSREAITDRTIPTNVTIGLRPGKATGFSFAQGQSPANRPVSVLATRDGNVPAGTLEHELTHSVIGSPSNQSPSTWTPHATTLGDRGKYLLNPAEVDVRLAEIKRWHAGRTGRLVDNPEEAARAWNEWHAPKLPGNDKTNSPFGPLGPTYRDGSYDKLPDNMKQEFQRRMIELVNSRNNSAQGLA